MYLIPALLAPCLNIRSNKVLQEAIKLSFEEEILAFGKVSAPILEQKIFDGIFERLSDIRTILKGKASRLS